ncbi:carboxypeptidase-like regulatory domain-containing protein, partial [Bacteroides heparinolyticus]
MKHIYIISALFLLSLFACVPASAQIKGVVTDSLTNEPLMYITVQYEGKGVGGISNGNGEYQVETRKGWNELTFSAVGYITKKVKFEPGTKVLNVKMLADDIMLSEVVVKP